MYTWFCECVYTEQIFTFVHKIVCMCDASDEVGMSNNVLSFCRHMGCVSIRECIGLPREKTNLR